MPFLHETWPTSAWTSPTWRSSTHLQINTLDGNDKVTVDPNVAPLIGLGVDLGLGQG